MANLTAQLVGSSWGYVGKHGPNYCVVGQDILHMLHTTLHNQVVWHGLLAFTLGQWQHVCQLWGMFLVVDCHLVDVNLLWGLTGQSIPQSKLAPHNPTRDHCKTHQNCVILCCWVACSAIWVVGSWLLDHVQSAP